MKRNVSVITTEYPAVASQLKNSVIDCRELNYKFGITPIEWKYNLRGVLH